jgi:hypothetical protein
MSYEEKARKNISNFYDDSPMPGGYNFNHVKTLKMIDAYYQSKYMTGDKDELGYRKFFFNIVKPACDIATKFVDLDTKDIILMPEGRDDELACWFMEKRLKQWLKEENFGVLLNEIAHDFPKYGHVVIKKSKDGWKKLNIQNLRLEPTARTLNQSPYVYEVLSMGKHEIEDMGWDTEELFSRGDEQTFLIYECYNRVGKKWKKTVYGDLYSTYTKDGINRSVETEIDYQNDKYVGALVLNESEVDALPYRELKWEEVPGRWLGYGFVEYLEENQIAVNEAENLERKGLMFTSLKLYQTRDESLGGSNVLTNTQNGDILKVESEITPIAMEERNLAAFNNTRTNWSLNIERKTFTSDITTGASLPSRTPLGVANLQASFASSYFEFKRENFGLFLKALLFEDIIPDFARKNSKAHTLIFASSEKDIEQLDELISETLVNEQSLNYAMKTGFFFSREEREAVKQLILQDLKKRKNRNIDIPANVYKNAKYYIDIEITGEGVDNGTKSQVLQLALQIVGTNPGIVQDPVSKQILTNLLALGGISSINLNIPASAQVPQQVAGSLAKPQAMQGNMATTQTI